MNRILTCPHCGPALSDTRLRCDRCGRELVYTTAAPPASPDAVERTPTAASRPRLWAGVAAAVVVVAASAGLLRNGGPPPAAAVPGRPAAPAEIGAPPAPVRPITPAAQADTHPLPEGNDLHKPGDLAGALEHYRAALGDKPADAQLLDNVGQILVAMNRPAEAVPFLKQAVEAEPFNVTARFDLAVASARCGQLKEAADEYAALVQAGTSDVRVLHNMGLALRQLGRHAEAAAAFAKATALAPGQAPGWLGLALSLEAEGRGPDAADALDRYLALQPSGPDADNVRARIARLRAAAEPASADQPDAGNGTSRRRP